MLSAVVARSLYTACRSDVLRSAGHRPTGHLQPGHRSLLRHHAGYEHSGAKLTWVPPSKYAINPFGVFHGPLVSAALGRYCVDDIVYTFIVTVRPWVEQVLAPCCVA